METTVQGTWVEPPQCGTRVRHSICTSLRLQEPASADDHNWMHHGKLGARDHDPNLVLFQVHGSLIYVILFLRRLARIQRFGFADVPRLEVSEPKSRRSPILLSFCLAHKVVHG